MNCTHSDMCICDTMCVLSYSTLAFFISVCFFSYCRFKNTEYRQEYIINTDDSVLALQAPPPPRYDSLENDEPPPYNPV